MKKSALKQLIREAIKEAAPVKQDPYGNDPNLDIKADKDIPGLGLTEDQLNEAFSPETDEIGAFFITEMPTLSSTIDDIVFECKDIAYFANQVKGGLSVNDIAGVFKNEAKAKKLGEKLLAERDKKKTEAKKAGEAYKKMKDEALAKVQEYMKTKSKTKQVVDELKDEVKS